MRPARSACELVMQRREYLTHTSAAPILGSFPASLAAIERPFASVSAADAKHDGAQGVATTPLFKAA